MWPVSNNQDCVWPLYRRGYDDQPLGEILWGRRVAEKGLLAAALAYGMS